MKSKQSITQAFKAASRAAVRKAFQSGIPVTSLQGNKIVRQEASGEKQTILSLGRVYAKPARSRYNLKHA